jgi:hypothetical protein
MAAWPFLLVGAAGSAVETWQSPLRVNLSLDTIWNSSFRVTLVGSVAAFAAAWYLGRRADKGMSDVFSSFWHYHQPKLRAELKRVNAQARNASQTLRKPKAWPRAVS